LSAALLSRLRSALRATRIGTNPNPSPNPNPNPNPNLRSALPPMTLSGPRVSGR